LDLQTADSPTLPLEKQRRKKGKKADKEADAIELQILSVGATVYFKILSWYKGCPDSCPYPDKHNAFVEGRLKEVDPKAGRYVFHFAAFKADSEPLKMKDLREWVEFELLPRREADHV
jgi:hypothetical protein